MKYKGGGQIDDYEWLTNEIGPWMNPVIVRQTLALYPHISRSLVYPHVLLKCDELDQKENEKKNEIQVKKEISEKKGIQQIEIQEIKVKERSKILDEKEANPSQHIDPRQENVRDVKRVSSAETMSTVCKTITPQVETNYNKTITPQVQTKDNVSILWSVVNALCHLSSGPSLLLQSSNASQHLKMFNNHTGCHKSSQQMLKFMMSIIL
eukprot:GHVL01019187.1.p1 GENE.GHVL01019187.1~~GHVL01019187.1.p1  ORF type:complete len:209 (+),score=29.25 GHVL01019187.1:941-1567(+)